MTLSIVQNEIYSSEVRMRNCFTEIINIKANAINDCNTNIIKFYKYYKTLSVLTLHCNHCFFIGSDLQDL